MPDRPVHHETAYDKAHEAEPEELRKRAARGRARYWLMKKLGAAALAGKDVDHIQSLKGGGAPDALSNLRVRSVHSNRGDKTY